METAKKTGWTAVRIAGATALAFLLLYGPQEAGHKVKGACEYLKDRIQGITPIGVKIETVSAKVAAKKKTNKELKAAVVTMLETRSTVLEQASRSRTRAQKRRARIASGEKILRQKGCGGFDAKRVKRSLASEREALAADEKSIREKEFRAKVLNDRAQLYGKKLEELDRHLVKLEKRIAALRRMQENNATLAEMVRVQQEIEAEFQLPPESSNPDFHDEVEALATKLRSEQAVLTEQLTDGVNIPGENVLDQVTAKLAASAKAAAAAGTK